MMSCYQILCNRTQSVVLEGHQSQPRMQVKSPHCKIAPTFIKIAPTSFKIAPIN